MFIYQYVCVRVCDIYACVCVPARLIVLCWTTLTLLPKIDTIHFYVNVLLRLLLENNFFLSFLLFHYFSLWVLCVAQRIIHPHMGQTSSRSQGTWTFGHVATTSTTIITPQQPLSHITKNATQKQCPSSQVDLVIAKPHFYALMEKPLPNPKNDDTTRLDRVDSGYTSSNNDLTQRNSHLDGDDKESLYNDVAYIDKKYYHQHNEPPPYPYNKEPLDGKRFTFMDVYDQVYNKSMQEIDASARRLINLSPNISCFKMIRRLNM